MVSSHISLNEWLIIEVGASEEPQFTPGLYKQPVDGEDVIWQMTIVATKTTVGISQGIFLKDFFFFFGRVRKVTQ